MYKSKFLSNSVKKHSGIKRSIVMLVSLMLVVATCVGVTVAYLSSETTNIVNTFVPGNVPLTINETFDDTLKKNVTVTNTGNVSAFVRAAIIVTWQDSEGNVAPTAPVDGKDYEMTLGSDWTPKDGFYYYKEAVAAKATTTALIEEAYQAKEYSGYQLHIEIVTQTIQSSPADVVQNVWGYVPGSN